MIEEIYIKNFILIKEESINFNKGLNIITGETGAGKSIILRAINVLIGDNAKSDYIGDFSNSAIIEGTFSINSKIKLFLNDNGIESEDNKIIITREITRNNSSTTRINGRRVTVKLIKNLSYYFIDYHGQHEHQVLLNTMNHINYLDSVDYDNIKNHLKEINELYNNIINNGNKLKKLKESNKLKDREIDFIKFQLNEINELNLKENELETLENEYKYLSNLENIKEIVGNSISDLKSENKIYEMLQDINYNLKSIEEYDKELKDINSEVSEILFMSEAVIQKMQDYFYNIEYNEYRLKEVEARINAINLIMKKYGNSYEILMDYKNELQIKLLKYDKIDEKIIELEKYNDNLMSEYKVKSSIITKIRNDNAIIFEKKLKNEFMELNMKDSNIKVSIKEKSEISSNGVDNIEFLISTNKGQPFRPLKDIVSGGELSRIMLAIKLITKNINKIPTLIFDEVDTGISGFTANIVGKKLKKISKDIQVITITHLPQIAAFSDYHIAVEKTVNNNKTISKVTILDEKGKTSEIAKLISGNIITKSSLESANELIKKSM